MTFQSKYKENKRFIQLYAEYLDECNSIDQKIKLSGEIGRLSVQNKHIDRMEYQETQQEYHYGKLEVQALL